ENNKKKRNPQKTTTKINSTSSSLTTETNSALSQLTIETNSTSPPLTTKDEHIQFILNLMKKWTENSKENLHLDQLALKPDVDY
ncbi:unnamed protein product, partial [Didymodactylos carnosus]